MISHPQPSSHDSQWVRKRIEAVASTLSLPTAKKALGMLEGVHQSSTRGSGLDMMGSHPYTAGEEARRIDWKASARIGKPMVIDYEQSGNDRVLFILDSSERMYSLAQGDQRIIDVATDALRMLGVLALRRGDEIALLSATEQAITRVPCNGGYRGLHAALQRIERTRQSEQRDIERILTYLSKHSHQHSLVVIATDELTWQHDHIDTLRTLAQQRPIILVNVQRMNPLTPSGARIIDGNSGRSIPAFMRTQELSEEIDSRRDFLAQQLKRQLTAVASTVVRAGSSEAMFTTVLQTISQSMRLSAGISSGLYSTRVQSSASSYHRLIQEA